MKYKEYIERVTEEILSDQIDYQSLREKLQEFMEFLLTLTKLDLKESSIEKNLEFDNGIALNTQDAALCVVDIMRTRQFVRGIIEAVKSIQNQGKSTIRIIYAGTGPFAMLILPLLTRYRSDELQLILLEVNEETSNHLKRLIEKLEIEDYIDKIVFEDASKYKIEDEEKVDILISETMQYGLVKEQQVPIMLNLVNQLDRNIIMIPQKIQLDLALMNSSTKLLWNNTGQSRYEKLKTVLEFDKDFIHAKSKELKQSQRIELCEQLQFKESGYKEYDKLVALTSIQVYGDEWITVDSSSLTIPKEIIKLEIVDESINKISMDYVIKEIPDFEYHLN